MSTDEDYQKKIFVAEYEKGRPFKGDEVAPILFRIVKPYIVGEILDVGAGSGALVRILKNKGFAPKGIDLYSTSNDIQKGSITNMPFGDASFDTLFCCDVIEHLADEQLNKGLSEVARILRKNGHFIVTTPHNEDLKSQLVLCPKCGHKFHRYGHLQSFDKGRLRELFESHGFETRFMRVYALGGMAKLPFGRYFHFILKRFDFEFIQKTIIGVWEKV
jgi:ubiquinone/menaquinone biosynthesis C-methylase UbiE